MNWMSTLLYLHPTCAVKGSSRPLQYYYVANAAKVMDTNLNFFMFCVKRRDGKAFDPLLSIDTAW